jgi:general stress protein YciG
MHDRDGRSDEANGHSVAPIPTPTKQRRGFAAMDPARQRELASRGGRASHAKGTGHEWNRDAARNAGKAGGIASGVSRNRKKAERLAAAEANADAIATPSVPDNDTSKKSA